MAEISCVGMRCGVGDDGDVCLGIRKSGMASRLRVGGYRYRWLGVVRWSPVQFRVPADQPGAKYEI
jgi:hypothetical protein